MMLSGMLGGGWGPKFTTIDLRLGARRDGRVR
jgi:hypothetical protein